MTSAHVRTSLATLLLLLVSRDVVLALVVPLAAANPATSLAAMSLSRVADGVQVDLGAALAATPAGKKSLVVLATHPADFNAIEYGQRVQHALPLLREKGVERVLMVANGERASCAKLAELLDLPGTIEVFADPSGEAGRRFGVSRGFQPDSSRLSPFAKLFAMGIGIGPPWSTLAAVGTGYLGNPWGRREWIEASLLQGQLAGRWPSVLELNSDGSTMARNKFDDFVLCGGWGRRPLELATLRLQNLASIQFQHWEALKPVDDRCLTQLGGCALVGGGGEALFSWVDRGLCDLPDLDALAESL